MTELEKKLKAALNILERASQEFRQKKESFQKTSQLEALRELVKEQISNENTVHSTREAR